MPREDDSWKPARISQQISQPAQPLVLAGSDWESPPMIGASTTVSTVLSSAASIISGHISDSFYQVMTTLIPDHSDLTNDNPVLTSSPNTDSGLTTDLVSISTDSTPTPDHSDPVLTVDNPDLIHPVLTTDSVLTSDHSDSVLSVDKSDSDPATIVLLSSTLKNSSQKLSCSVIFAIILFMF